MAAGWTAGASTAARRLFLERQSAFWRRELRDPRARVVAIIAETRDTKTFVLQPPAGWRRHRAGQYAMVEIEVDGVRLRRCYSLSSAPGDPHVAITVKRLPGGRVSGWLHDRARIGDALGLGPAAGHFVLPTPTPEKLLFLSGGSGITPITSMLRQLARQGDLREVVLVHCARTRDDIIFRAELEALAATHGGLRLVWCLSDDPTGSGRLDEGRLAQLIPDFAARATFLCGPPGLMASVERMWQAAGAGERLRRERFVAKPPAARASDARVRVRLSESARDLVANTSGTLLEQLEQSGVRPPYGCRIGICHTCKRRKHAGTVLNLTTGVASSELDEDIQLCISAPLSDVELSL
jgi:ferredoxin-NADP reductase